MSRTAHPYRDHAVLLRRHPYGESSLVVHVLTREHGRVALLAKGAYRPTSRYFGVLDFGATRRFDLDGGLRHGRAAGD